MALRYSQPAALLPLSARCTASNARFPTPEFKSATLSPTQRAGVALTLIRQSYSVGVRFVQGGPTFLPQWGNIRLVLALARSRAAADYLVQRIGVAQIAGKHKRA